MQLKEEMIGGYAKEYSTEQRHSYYENKETTIHTQMF
jgi:hypothetical protein